MEDGCKKPENGAFTAARKKDVSCTQPQPGAQAGQCQKGSMAGCPKGRMKMPQQRGFSTPVHHEIGRATFAICSYTRVIKAFM